MRKSAIIMPLLALIAGAAGFSLRLREIADVFGGNLAGLAERGAPITLALIALSAAVLLMCLIFALVASSKRKSSGEFEEAFGTDTIAYPIIFSALGIVWLGATVKYLINASASGAFPLMDLYFVVLSALAAVSVIFFAVEVFQDPRCKSKFPLSVVPSLFMCFWLILMYRDNAANPVLLSYAYQCLAIITSALGFYFTSGFVFSKAAPGKTIFFYLASVFFCFVTLADDIPVGIKIIFAAIICLNLVHSSMLIRNLRRAQ